MNVLIAEDDMLVRKMLEMYLGKWGFTYTSTTNGIEAWQAYLETDFDILITDWMMPGIDGSELCSRIRKSPKSNYTYIIFLTSLNSKDFLAMGIEKGADDYIAKPLEPAELRARLKAGQRILKLEHSLSESNAKMTYELEKAADTLQSLLPTHSNLAEGIGMAWYFKPSIYIGGDIFNVLRLDEDNVAFYVLDVTGHGVSAALLAVTLRNVLRPSVLHGGILKMSDRDDPNVICDPHEVAQILNRRFQVDEDTGMFFTIFYAVLNLRTRCLRWVRAGHPMPIILSKNGTSRLEKGGLPIGIIERYDYEDCEVIMNPSDTLLMYSDGLIEATDDDGNQFGMERLERTIKEGKGDNPDQMIARIKGKLETFMRSTEPEDDITLLAIGFD